MKSGMGRDGFVWFEGVVEDRMDPLGIGRMRVRTFGFDSADKLEVPTEYLPWAYPMLPLDSDQGEVHTPKEGTWVLGFFRDGEDAQDRVILGTINTGAFVSPPLNTNFDPTKILSDIAGKLGKQVLAERAEVSKVSEHSKFGGITVPHSSDEHAEDRAIDIGTGGSYRPPNSPLSPHEKQAPIVSWLKRWAVENDVALIIYWTANSSGHDDHIHVGVEDAPTQLAAAKRVSEGGVA